MGVNRHVFWTDEEMASASVEDLRKHGELVKRQADEFAKQYVREMADKPSPFWGAYDKAVQQMQESTRYGLARLVGQSSEEARQFRYNSMPLFRGYATFVHSWGQALQDYSGPADASMLAKISAHAGKLTALESQQGYPWATQNHDEAEKIALNTLDPMLLASFATDGLKGFAEAREIKAMTPFAKAIMEAPNPEGVVLAGRPLWGMDTARPLFSQAVSEMAKAGATPEDVAKMLHTQGLRTSNWAASASLPLSKYFKRGNNLASPGLMDRMEAAFGQAWAQGKKPEITGKLPQGLLPADLLKLKSAMKAEYEQALSKLPGLTTAEKDLVDWAEKNIPRDQYDPLGSFRRGYASAVQRGEAPAVDETLYRKMEAYVNALSSGWREGTAWRSTYSTGLRDAQRINLGLDPIRGVSEQELAQRPWRLQQQSQGTIQGVENFARWHAHVASREINADRAEQLIEAVQARVQELGGSGNATELELTRQLQTDLRRIVQDPGHIKYDQTQKVSKLLAAYDYSLATMKTAMLKFSPGFYVHRAVDMGAMRSLATTGESHLWDTVKAAWTKNPAPIRDIFGMSFHAGEGLEKTMGILGDHTAIGSMDQEALNHIARYAYDEHVGNLLKTGMPPKTADRLAKRAAAAMAETVHGIYSAEGPATDILDRTHFFWRHYYGRMAFWGKMAYGNPGETYALTRLRELQQQHSVDGRGALPIPGTRLAVDPVGRLTPIQVMEPATNPDYFLRPYESAAYVPARAAHAVLGDWTTPFQAAGEHVGVLPPSGDRPMADIENVVGMVTRAVTGQTVLPSDPFMHLLGRNPEESRQDYDDRKAQMFSAAAQRAGQPISAQEARQQAESATTEAQLASFATGQRVLPMPPGMAEIAQAASTYREVMMATPPEDRGPMREVMMQSPTFAGLQHILPLDPASKFDYLEKRSDLEVSRLQAAEPSAPTQDQVDTQDREQRFKNIQEAIQGSPLGGILEKAFDLFASPAGATELDQDPPRSGKPTKWGVNSYGHSVQIPDGNDPSAYIRAKNDFKNFQMDETALQTQGVSLQKIHDYISQAKQSDGTNPLLADIQNQAPTRPTAQAYLDAYNYVEQGSGSVRGDLPAAASRNIQSITQAFGNYVRGSGMGAAQLIKMSPDQVRELASSGRLAAVGVGRPTAQDHGAWDDYAIRSAQQASQGLVGYAQGEYQRRITQQYPQTNPMVRELEQVVSRSPYSTHAEIEKIGGMIQDGHLAPTFWSDAFGTDGSLYLRTAVANHQQDLALVQDQLFPWGPNKGVNPYRLGEILMEPHGSAYVNMLRSYGSPQVQEQLNSLADKPIPLHNGATLDNLAPINPQQLDATFGEDLNIKVGLTQSLHSQLSNLIESPSPAAAPQAGLAQQLTQPTPNNPVGNAQAALDFNTNAQGPVHEQIESQPVPTATPSLIQSGADVAHQISQNFFSSSESTPAISFQPPTMPPPQQPRFYNTLPEFWNAWSQNRQTDIQQAQKVEQSLGMPQGSLTPSGYSTFVTTLQNNDGSFSMNAAPAASAALNLAHLGENLAGVNPNSDLASGISGAQTGLSAGMEAMQLAQWAGAGATYGGWIGAGVGIAAGIATGLMSHNGGNNDIANANYQVNKQRLQLQKDEFAETERKTGIADLRQNERDLLGTARSAPPATQAKLGEQLTINPYVFHPTFASRIGLVDQIEGSLRDTLTPRY